MLHVLLDHPKRIGETKDLEQASWKNGQVTRVLFSDGHMMVNKEHNDHQSMRDWAREIQEKVFLGPFEGAETFDS